MAKIHNFYYLYDMFDTCHYIMKTVSIIPFLLILSILGCTTNKTSQIYDNGISLQLAQSRKSTIKEIEYTLSFIIPEEKEQAVNGEINISFIIDNPKETIIDFREIEKIKELSVNGNTVPYETINEHIIIPASASKKGRNDIAISFIAGDQSLNRNNEFLYTLLVPDRARTVFPCFDQPDLKASFTLTLEIPNGWTAISNSPVLCEERNNGKNIVKFKPTEPLSTYLFSFVAGKFKKEIYSDSKHTFAAYHRETDPKRIAQLPTIFNQVAKSLTWLEEYTGIPYPFSKYDFIILPGFQYGGMEHTGATLYNDNLMFLGENPTPDEELDRAHLIAHETAHMWFGDYVTMNWFDDVWTKEVFANYFASRICDPMFPTINHRLNWLKSIVTPSLAEDRTQGGTAIKQPLDNMSNAGLIYNNIIYDKAPVMLEKLIEIMGEDAFRAGLHDYLKKHNYGNASWDDLIAILESKSSTDLKAFGNTWVYSSGMPHIDFIREDSCLTIRQSDPYKRELVWRQKFNVTLIGNTTEEIEINMDCKEFTIPLTDDIEYILPNTDGRGYGYFKYDNNSMEWILKNWHCLKDDTSRQAQLMNIHESYQHNEINAERWLSSLIDGLIYEENPLIASTICNYLQRPLAEAGNSDIERRLMTISQEHKITSCRIQLLRTLIATATDSLVCDRLYNIWEEASHPFLNENDYMDLAYELSIRYPEKRNDIITTQRSRISNPDRIRQFDFVSRATTPDTAEQERLFKSLLIAENRRIEPWTLMAISYLCHPLREAQAIKYIRPALDSLQEIQRTSDIFFPRNWVYTILSERHSKEALHEVKKFMDSNPDYPVLLKNKILQAMWTLQRIVTE